MTSTSEKTALKSVSAIFKDEKKMQEVVERLIDRSVPKDHISMIGRDFHTETRISGFVTKQDVILDGLATGAIFGSLFGSLLALLTGVGVLFIPFLGTVVAAGPLGAALLGAAGGALYGSLGAGIGSALIAMGMPEDKAAIYETRLKTGEFLLVAEVPQEQADEVVSLLESAGAEEVAITDMKIPRQPKGELADDELISPEIRANLSDDAQKTFVDTYNRSFREANGKDNALAKAWDRVKQMFDRDEQGTYSKSKVIS